MLLFVQEDVDSHLRVLVSVKLQRSSRLILSLKANAEGSWLVH